MFKLSVHKFLYNGMAALLVIAFALGASGVQVAHAAGYSVLDAGSYTAFLSAIGGAGTAGGNPFTGFTCFVNNGKLGETDALTVSGNMLF